MDSSSNHSMNGAQHANNQSFGFLDGIQSFATSDGLQGADDFSYYDPALFESSAMGAGFSQQPSSLSQNFDSNASRQSNSPVLQQQYNHAQQSYPQHQYSQSLYDSRQIAQSNYDPRFYTRPSPSPVAFDAGYNYQPHMGYSTQNYNPQHLNIPQRQTPTPTQTYQPIQQQQQQQQQPQQQPQQQQQQPSAYVNIGPRPPSQLSHIQNAEAIRFANYQDQSHQASNHYVDPSMLTANQMMSTNNNSNYQTHQTYIAPSYFKTGSTLDPRSLQGMQPLQPMPAAPSPAPQQVIQPKPEKAEQIIGKVLKPKASRDPHAPKKPKSQRKKDGPLGSRVEGQASDSGSNSDSGDELEVEDEEPPELTPALLTVSMPTDERGKALYSAVQAVWSPRNKSAPPEKIRNGIAGFGDTVRGLRDAWKARNDSLKEAELPGSPTAADASRLKEEVAHYRQVTESVMARALLYGHPAVVKRLGENQFTMSALYSFMLDRFNASDFDSSLVNAILKFVVKFETLDTEMLEMTKLSKILQRFTKKATSEVKSMAQTILSNAIVASSKKAAAGGEGKAEKPASPRSVGSPADGARKEMVTGMKRPREGDAASQTAPKKVVKVIAKSSKPLALQNAERRKALEAAKAGEKAATATTAASTTAKAKVAVSAPPKSAVFSSLLSASKRPGTSIAARAAAAKDKPISASSPSPVPSQMKKENAAKESPPLAHAVPAPMAKATSSFLGLLADIGKKPEKEVKKEAEIPDETEEQKAKRLRKEERRRLRVSWKADTELVEIRHFTHDPEEEIGHGDSMRRDAGDTGREGEALKLHKDLMDELEEEEDEDSFEEFEPYTSPSEVDFTVLRDELLGTDSPDVMNSPKFGGTTKPESRSSEIQNKYEQDTLMALYTSKADRPATPKEPVDNTEDEGDFEPAEPETPFGEPSEIIRQREKEYLARQARGHATTNANVAKTDLAAQIQALTATQATQPQSAGISAELQRALSMLGQPNQPTPQPQAANNVDFQTILHSVQQVTQRLQGQNQQPQYQTPSTTPALPANLSALLASMQSNSQTQPSGLPVGLGSNPNPYPGALDESSRKHARSDSNDNDNDHGRKGGNKKKKSNLGGVDQSKPYNYKTQMCSFWEQGKCLKGDACTYRHGDE